MTYQHPTLKVYSADRAGNVYWNDRGVWKKKATRLKDGYVFMQVKVDGKQKHKAVHQMVYECLTYTTPTYSCKSDGMVINHINEVKTDNRIDNLELITCSANTRYSTLGRQGKKRFDRIYRNTDTNAVYVGPMSYLAKAYGRNFDHSTYRSNRRCGNIEYLGRVSDL